MLPSVTVTPILLPFPITPHPISIVLLIGAAFVHGFGRIDEVYILRSSSMEPCFDEVKQLLVVEHFRKSRGRIRRNESGRLNRRHAILAKNGGYFQLSLVGREGERGENVESSSLHTSNIPQPLQICDRLDNPR